MLMNELVPGQFFKFQSPGYCFGQCLHVGTDKYGYCTFIHKSAGGDRYILNNVIREYNPEVLVIDMSENWQISRIAKPM